MRFGVSTHLFHDHRLQRKHLAQVAGYGFESIELFATRSHFDYHDPSSIDALAGWLRETGLRLHGVHAPIADAVHGDNWGGATYSTAAGDGARRQAAVREAEAALRIAERIPFEVMVVHLGVPAGKNGSADNSRAAATRSAEELARIAEPTGVRIAFEVIPNDLSSAAALVKLLERDLEAPHVGICMDFGHAHLMGDVADAVELAAEHLITTHVHDNRGRQDDHLVPYLGSIDWDASLVTMQKIGYEGTYLMEVANTGSPAAVLEEARRARQRFERTLTHA
ncbi:MAG: sugar phosphate isomerase/epimerase [Acidobacteria bacterium]|nr:sugar phosphate isomerase/epimerase [Acidobacteriota bacterium]MBA3888022.1 sugar phosphate isomerase/epimerase [Acidobacteriota bacterium]